MNKNTKTKPIIIFISLLVCISSLFSACSHIPLDNSDIDKNDKESSNETDISPEIRIKELETKIITLLQNQEISENERKKEISALKAELDVLKKKESDKSNETSTEKQEPKIFNYTLNGYKATITSINTDEESISIPAVIDGHAVTAIGSEALASSKIKRIVLEDGIESLDWFAFKGCPALSSVTIPASVTSIGYGAFDGSSKSLIIECKKDSFAMKYAQSYGIKYDIKQ